VEALGSNDEVLGTTRVPAPLPYFLFQASTTVGNMIRAGGVNTNWQNHIALLPALQIAPYDDRNNNTRLLTPGTPVHRQRVYMEFPRQELDKITTVRFSYE